MKTNNSVTINFNPYMKLLLMMKVNFDEIRMDYHWTNANSYDD